MSFIRADGVLKSFHKYSIYDGGHAASASEPDNSEKLLEQAIQAIESCNGDEYKGTKIKLLGIATSIVTEHLEGVIERLKAINSELKPGVESNKLLRACQLLTRYAQHLNQINSLHASIRSDKDYFDKVAQTFAKYGPQLAALIERDGEAVITKGKGELIKLLAEFDKEIALDLKVIMKGIDIGPNNDLTNLLFLLRRRADLHRTFVLGLNNSDGLTTTDQRLGYRNALAAAAYFIQLQITSKNFTPTFIKQIKTAPPTGLMVLDEDMHPQRLSLESILILDFIASYREGSLTGNLGKEPAIHNLDEVDVGKSAADLMSLISVINPMLEMVTDQGFINVLRKFIDCERMRLIAIESKDQYLKDNYNKEIERCVAMIKELPKPLNEYTGIALAPIALSKIAETN